MNKMLAVGAFMGLASAAQGCDTDEAGRNRHLEVCGEPTIERVCVETVTKFIRATGTVHQNDSSANVVVTTVLQDADGRLVRAETTDSARGVDSVTGDPRFDVTHRVPHDGELSSVVVAVEKPGFCKSPKGVHFAFGVDNADAAGTVADGTVADPLPLEMCTVPDPNPTPRVEETPPPYVPECEPAPEDVCVEVRYSDKWDKILDACVGTNATGDCVDPEPTPTPDPVRTPEPGPACTVASNGEDHYFETCVGVNGPIQDRCLSDTSRQFALCDPSVGCDYGEPVPCPENQLCLIDASGAPRCREPIPTPQPTSPPLCTHIDPGNDGWRETCVEASGFTITDRCLAERGFQITRCDGVTGCGFDEEILCDFDAGERCVVARDGAPGCYAPEEPTPTPGPACELIDLNGNPTDRYLETCADANGLISNRCDTATSYQFTFCHASVGCNYGLSILCPDNQLCTVDPNGAPRCYEPEQPTPSPTPTPVLTRLIDCENGHRRDVMLVLDRSWSMNFQTPSGSTGMAALRFAMDQFVDSLSPSPGGVHIGQTSFGQGGFIDLHLSHDVNAIHAAIHGMVNVDGTYMAESIGLARREFANPGDYHDRPDSDAPDIMLIVTDGQALDSVNAIAEADVARREGIEIFTVGTGENINGPFLQQLATDDGHFSLAPTGDDLAETLHNIDLCQSVRSIPTP